MASDTMTLVESFTRIIHLFRFSAAAIADVVAALDARTVPFRKGPGPLWEPWSAKEAEKLTRFFGSSTQDYLVGPIDRAQCFIRRMAARAVNKYGHRLAIAGRVASDLELVHVDVFLFRTGVGVMSLEFRVENALADGKSHAPTLQDLSAINAALARTQPARAPRLHRRSALGAGAPQDDPITSALSGTGLTLATAVDFWLAVMNPALGMEPADELGYKVQTFAGVANVSDTVALQEPLLYLRRVASGTHRATQADLDWASPEVCRTSENVLVGASKEGMAMILAETGVAFDREMADRVRTSYFGHYLLALHQRAALLEMDRQIGQFPASPSPGASNLHVSRLAHAYNDFGLRHRLEQVSSHPYYGQVYSMLTAILDLRGLDASVKRRLEALNARNRASGTSSLGTAPVTGIPTAPLLQPSPKTVFISHKSSDREVAEAVCAELELLGISCWISVRDIPPGEDYPTQISLALETCRVLVLIYSEGANSSRHVLREVDLADRNRLAIIALRLDATPAGRGLGYFLNTTQWIDAMSGIDDALPPLVGAIRQIAATLSKGAEAGLV